MIEANHIIKTYIDGEVRNTVLHGITLSIPKGQFVSLIGRSGAGKSTLMHQLSLLDTPTEGYIILDGVNTSHLSSKEKTNFRLRKLGYIFQDYALLPELTALENVMLPLLMMGESGISARKKGIASLDRIGLGSRHSNLPGQLSGGEQQRVSVARAVAHDPSILFADEPTANLDSETARKVIDLLLELHADGQTIVMVTHEHEYASLTQRTLLLEDGTIQSDTVNT